MSDKTITCPKCGEQFELSEGLYKDVEASIKKHFDAELKVSQKQFEMELSRRQADLKKSYEERLLRIEEDTKKKAVENLDLEISDLKDQLQEKAEKLDLAQKHELELRKQQRELDEKTKAFELEMQRKLDIERSTLRDKIVAEIEDQHMLKDADKDKQLADMKKQIDELKRKAEQGSQKMQGEVLELEFEQRLRNEFLFDEIEPVSSGVRGADVIQIVKTQSGQECGKILWETKRTKAWSDSWLQKIKNDLRDAKADIAVVVSEALPKEITQFRQIKGVWVSDLTSSISLALALRVGLIRAAHERKMQSGKKEKMEVLYEYLTGPEFRNRIEAVMESFLAMKADLDTEKRAMERLWAKREKQISHVVLNLSGMHGELEGIAGKTLPVVQALELPE